MGALLLERLRQLQQRHEFIAEIRGKGPFVAMRFGEPRSLKPRTEWTLAQKAAKGLFGETVVMALTKHHRILSQIEGYDPDVLKITPPLLAGEAEIDWIVHALDGVLEGYKKASGPCGRPRWT